MGNSQTVKSETPEFQPNEWEIVPPSSLQEQHQDFGRICVLKHKVTGESIDQYQMVWPNEEDYMYYLYSFNWRSNQQSIVNSKFIRLLSNDSLSIDVPFCSQVYSANIYIEHILTRLSQISDIPYPDNLYILMEALQGYEKLHEFSSDFTVEENQICVDTEGNIKVWVSSYLARNYPDDEPPSLPQAPSHDKMVRDIVRIITSNTDEDSQPKNFLFKNYFAQAADKKNLTFNDAKLIVNQYANSTETVIPTRFQSIFWIYGDSQNLIDQNVEQQPNPYISGTTEQGINQPSFYDLQVNPAYQNTQSRPILYHSGPINQPQNQQIYQHANVNQSRQIQPLRSTFQNPSTQHLNRHYTTQNNPRQINYTSSLLPNYQQMSRAPPQLRRTVNPYVQNNQPVPYYQNFKPAISQFVPVMHRNDSNPYHTQIINNNSHVRFAGNFAQNHNQRQLFGSAPLPQFQSATNKAYIRNLLQHINPANQENFATNQKNQKVNKKQEFQLSQVSREIVSIDELPNEASFPHGSTKPFQKVIVPEMIQKNKNSGFNEKMKESSQVSFEMESGRQIKMPNIPLKSVPSSSTQNQGEMLPSQNIQQSFKNPFGNQSRFTGKNSLEHTPINFTDNLFQSEELSLSELNYEKLKKKTSSIKMQRMLYYSSLDQEAEIDEQIAADLLKFMA